MPQDISKDPRVLIVEYALKKLKDLTINKRYKLPASKEKTLEAIGKLTSTIKSIKFSYISPTDLVNDRMVKELDLMANQFWDAIMKNQKLIEKDKFITTELGFIFNVLKGFKERLGLGNEVGVDKAIDIIAVKIVSVTKLDKNGDLSLCRVGNGRRVINIITNLNEIKKDMVVPAAILPPRAFGSEISEAMFCSSQDLPNMYDLVGERIRELPEEALKEVIQHILSLLKDV